MSPNRALRTSGGGSWGEAAAYRAVFHWANRYNTRRRHSAIGNISPNAYENATLATLKNAA